MMIFIVGAYPGSFNNSNNSFSETIFTSKSKAIPAIIKLPTNIPAVTIADKAKNLVKKEYFNGYFDCMGKDNQIFIIRVLTQKNGVLNLSFENRRQEKKRLSTGMESL